MFVWGSWRVCAESVPSGAPRFPLKQLLTMSYDNSLAGVADPNGCCVAGFAERSRQLVVSKV